MQIAERPDRVQPAPAGVRHLIRAETGALAALGLAKLALHLATDGIYGFHRDELYYLASGRHLALGYVDYPPLTPLLARLGLTLFGPSAGGLRLLSALAGAVVVVLAGLVARELGGGRFAQLLAAGAALASPLLLGSNWLFQTVTFDQLAWTVAILLTARLVRTGEPRWWLAVGLALGIGLETKYTILALGAGLLAGVLATRLRRHLRTPWPWLGALIALLIAAPNLAWQVAHGWPSLGFILSHHQDQAADFSPPVFLALQLPLAGPLALPLWLAGWYRLLRQRDMRPLGVAAAVAFGIFLVVGKDYYAGPLYPLLLAAGAVSLEALGGPGRGAVRLRAAAVAAVALNGLLLLPLALPLVPVSQLHRSHLDTARKDYADTVGWPELTDQVAAVYGALPPEQRRHATVLAANYGEAGAIDLYGPARGLPPAICPQLTYALWKPAHVEDATVVLVGYTPEFAARYFADVEPAAAITPPDGVRTEERGLPILVAHRPRVPLDQAWPELRRLS
jgi:hypothetical protein